MSVGVAITCALHKGDLLEGLAVNLFATCKVADCRKRTRWGLDGDKPTHCNEHGPMTVGLRRTVGTDRTQNVYSRRPSYRAVRGPSFRVKVESVF